MINRLRKNSIFRHIMLNILKVISLINQIIPKKDQILFYDSIHGYLDDNTGALYHYLERHGFRTKYRLICCVPNERNTYSSYKPVGFIRGVVAYLTSRYVFFSNGDFRIRPSREQVVVQQWHGSPLKRIGKSTTDKKDNQERLDNFTYLLAASDLFVPIMAKAFGCSIDKVKVLGHTRNDQLFSKKDAFQCMKINRKAYKKVILWMPTFRKSSDLRFMDGDITESDTALPIISTFKQLLELDNFLQRENILLIIKIHPAAIYKNNMCANIITMKNEDLNKKDVKLYEFVKEFDALITDYSSIICDYLLLNRPIAFTLDDYEKYKKSRGFNFDNLKEYLPGHHIYDVEDMYCFISDISKGIDCFKEKREKVCKLFNKYLDAENCKRLADAVGLTLN